MAEAFLTRLGGWCCACTDEDDDEKSKHCLIALNCFSNNNSVTITDGVPESGEEKTDLDSGYESAEEKEEEIFRAYYPSTEAATSKNLLQCQSSRRIRLSSEGDRQFRPPTPYS